MSFFDGGSAGIAMRSSTVASASATDARDTSIRVVSANRSAESRTGTDLGDAENGYARHPGR